MFLVYSSIRSATALLLIRTTVDTPGLLTSTISRISKCSAVKRLPTTEQHRQASVFLSIVQDFGPRRKTEGYVNILHHEKGHLLRHDPARRQIVVILKELGPDTYTCLQDPPPDPPRDWTSSDDESMDDVDEEDRREV